jgi:hypothetical protein
MEPYAALESIRRHIAACDCKRIARDIRSVDLRVLKSDCEQNGKAT